MKKILHLIAFLCAISFSYHVQSQNISAPSLGAAQEFAVLGSSAVVSTGTTLVYADLGTSPGTTITGFAPGVVLGQIRPGTSEAAAAKTDASRIYTTLGNFAASQNLTGQQLGRGFGQTPEAINGTTLNPGVYRFDGDARIHGQVRLNGQGSTNSVFVIQVNGDLIIDEGSVLSVLNGAEPRNIFFRVTGNVIIGNQGLAGTASALKGNIFVQNNITLSNGTTHEGRLISLDGTVTLNDNTVFLPTIIEADLAITKTADKSTVAIGDIVTYTITVRNQGPSNATGVQVRETLPAQLAFVDFTSSLDGAPANFTYNATTSVFTIGNLAVGQTATILLRARVLSFGTDIRNRVSVISDQPDPDDEDDEDEVPVEVPVTITDLEVTKTVDKTRARIGDALVYTITARNNGAGNATGVTLRDVLPVSQLTINGQPTASIGNFNTSTGIWTIGNLAAGQSATLTVLGTITTNGTIVNTVTIGGNEADQQPENNTSTVITVVGVGPGNPGVLADLQVVKTVDKARASVGETLTYLIRVRNAGPSNATAVTLTDVLPRGQLSFSGQPTISAGSYNATTGVWTIGNLAAGQGAFMRVTGTITINSGIIENTAVVSGDETDERPENNISTVITVVGRGEPNPTSSTDLQVVKTVDKATARLGETLTYNVTVTNNGPNNATGVLMIDILPRVQVNFAQAPAVSVGSIAAGANIWNIGNLAAGQTATLTVTGTITASGTIVNTATVRSDEADTQPQNNTSTVITIVNTRSDQGSNLSIQKRVDGNAEVVLGQQITYVLRAANAGPAGATNVTVTDVLPAGLEFVSTTPAADFNISTRTLTWTIGNLGVGDANTRELRITTRTTQIGRIANTAVVNGTELDPDDDDNTDTEEVCVRPSAPIFGNTTICLGNTASFTITPIAGVTNFEVTGLPEGVTRVGGTGNTITLQVSANAVPGAYTISVIAVNSEAGCSNSLPSSATLTISTTPVTPGPITIGAGNVCSSQPITFSVAAVAGATNYVWTAPQGWTYNGRATGPFTTTEPTIELVPSTNSGTVSVQASNSCGTGTASTSATITPNITPTAPTLSNNSGPCLGLAFSVVSPEAGITYTWTAPAGFTITGGQGTSAITLRLDTPGAKGTLSVTASNGVGTCASNIGTTEISASDVESQLLIPTIFSPNGDGINDVWVIRNLLGFPDNDLYVYNRWGNEVYQTRGYRNNWAATGLEEATYYYVLRVRGCNGQEQVYKGFVQVAR